MNRGYDSKIFKRSRYHKKRTYYKHVSENNSLFFNKTGYAQKHKK